jgi:hypothetical protein
MGQNLRKARKLRLRNPQNQGCRRQRRRQSCKRPQKGPSSPQHNVTWEISAKNRRDAMYEFRLFLVFFAVFVILGALASEMWSLSLIHYAVIAAVSCGAMLASKKLFKPN